MIQNKVHFQNCVRFLTDFSFNFLWFLFSFLNKNSNNKKNHPNIVKNNMNEFIVNNKCRLIYQF